MSSTKSQRPEIPVMLLHKNLTRLRRTCRQGLLILRKTSTSVSLSLLDLWGLVRIFMSRWQQMQLITFAINFSIFLHLLLLQLIKSVLGRKDRQWLG